MSIPISQLVTGVVNGEVEIPGTNPLDTTSSLNGTTFKYLVSDILQYILSAQGFTTYQSCIAASTIALTATYDNGTAGVGATLTNAGAQAAITLDGVTLAVDDRVLIKNQVSTAENGIYVVTNIGSASTNWVLTRATDYDQASEIVYLGIVLINQGASQKGIIYQEMSQGPFVIGTSPITFQALTIDVSLLPSASPANKLLRSDGTYWVASTSTFADTYSASSLLYSNGANTVQGLATANSATLVTDATGVPAWTSSMTNGQVLIGSTGAAPVPATLTGSGGITISNAAGSITISGSGGGFSWTEVTGTTQSMAVNNGYISSNASQVVLTLPATAAIGDTVKVQGKGTGGWRVAQNAGQIIHFNSATSTLGVSGYIESTQRYNSVELVCITANNEWAVNSVSGNLTVF